MLRYSFHVEHDERGRKVLKRVTVIVPEVGAGKAAKGEADDARTALRQVRTRSRRRLSHSLSLADSLTTPCSAPSLPSSSSRPSKPPPALERASPLPLDASRALTCPTSPSSRRPRPSRSSSRRRRVAGASRPRRARRRCCGGGPQQRSSLRRSSTRSVLGTATASSACRAAQGWTASRRGRGTRARGSGASEAGRKSWRRARRTKRRRRGRRGRARGSGRTTAWEEGGAGRCSRCDSCNQGVVDQALTKVAAARRRRGRRLPRERSLACQKPHDTLASARPVRKQLQSEWLPA